MARARKKHIQQSFEYRTHGGKRLNAGRPSKRERPSEPHGKRDDVDPRYPLHVSTRVAAGLGSLRKKDIFEAIRGATLHQTILINTDRGCHACSSIIVF